MKVLVTGRNGQLGSELHRMSSDFAACQFLFADVTELDITNKQACDRFFEEHAPDICINAAAYTAVDKAETDQELAFKVNAGGARNLAECCAANDARFIHVSTDYIFNGAGTAPYREDHPAEPVNFYGYSKLRGEELAFEKNPDTVVVRTSWVYSVFGNNFVKTMLRLMSQRDSLNVVADQLGSPTYATDLAAALMTIATSKTLRPGIFHYSNRGEISWFDFAMAIRDLAQLRCEVIPVTTDQYPTLAKRPAYSVMEKNKIQSLYHIELKDWQESLQKCITLMRSQPA